MRTTPSVYFGQSPYLSSRILNFVQELTEKLGKGSEDFLFIEPYSIGDAVHTFGLLPAFRRTYCREDQRIVVLCQERAMPVSTVMPFADICFSGQLAPHELAFEYLASLSTVLTPQLPLVCAPDMHAFGRIGRAAGNALAAKRSIFYLRQDEPFAPPVIADGQRAEVEGRMEAQGMARGRAVILFPHALSLEDPGHDFWPVLAGRLAAARPDLALFTDVTTGIAPVPGTRGLSLGLADVIPAVEYAGGAVLLRSGLVDLLAHARGRIVSVVPPKSHYRFIPKTFEPQDLFIARLFPETLVRDVILAGIDAGAAEAACAQVAAHIAGR